MFTQSGITPAWDSQLRPITVYNEWCLTISRTTHPEAKLGMMEADISRATPGSHLRCHAGIMYTSPCVMR